MKTLYILVTCCLEPGRLKILKTVLDNIRSQPNFAKIRESLVVFDNASSEYTDDEFAAMLYDFKYVYRCTRNVGYWTALRWVTTKFPRTLDEYDFVYSIESDCIHDDMRKIHECEDFLAHHPSVGMVRTQEFEVENRHLYDKGNPLPDSRVYAWQSQQNRFTGEPVYFNHVEGQLYTTNFTAVMCGLTRYDDAVLALECMASETSISEADYQVYFNKHYAENAVYDGGLFHSRLSFTKDAVAGSRPWTHGNTGYRCTQHDVIDANDTFRVDQIMSVTTQPLEQHQTPDGIMYPIYRSWDAWHGDHLPLMVYATTINPKVIKDVILHERRTSLLTAITGEVRLTYRHGFSTPRTIQLRRSHHSLVVKVPPNVPIQLENVSLNETAIVINTPTPAWHPDDPDTIKFKCWNDYETYMRSHESSRQ